MIKTIPRQYLSLIMLLICSSIYSASSSSDTAIHCNKQIGADAKKFYCDHPSSKTIKINDNHELYIEARLSFEGSVEYGIKFNIGHFRTLGTDPIQAVHLACSLWPTLTCEIIEEIGDFFGSHDDDEYMTDTYRSSLEHTLYSMNKAFKQQCNEHLRLHEYLDPCDGSCKIPGKSYHCNCKLIGGY